MGPAFSRRLDWRSVENALAKAEARVRETGATLLDLTSSNPTEVGFPDESEALREAFARAEMSRYQATPRGSTTARRHVADTYYRDAGSPIDPDQLILTASSSESYSFLLKLLANPGDIVLVPEPSYPLFDYLAALEGVEARRYRLSHEGIWHLDRHSIEDALAHAQTQARAQARPDTAAEPGAPPARVAAIVVVSPNNPTGSVLGRDDLLWLDGRCAAAGIALIADEVFSDFTARPGPDQIKHVAAHPTDSLTFSLGGLSKSCGLPQLKLGWIAVGGAAATAAAAISRLELIADTYLSVATPVQAALPDLLAIGARRRAAIVARIAENRAALARAIGADSPLALLGSDGGWSAIVRVPAIRTDEQWALTLLERERVLVQPGYFFELRGGTFIVLSLLPPVSTFTEGVRRLVALVEGATRSITRGC
jgi:hypothetical protein